MDNVNPALAGRVAVEANGLTIYGPAVRGRSCGSCKACCTQIPVELHGGERKPAGVRCKHLVSKGCGIYARRPDPCRYWSCRWLFDDDTSAMRRPDHSGCIVDPALDTVMVEGQPLDVLQVWCDPARRDAHRDPALRAYLEAMHAKHGLMTFVRYNSQDGFMLAPPRASDTGEWLEVGGDMISAEALAEKLAPFGGRRLGI
jgi:hypothetical protein